MLIRFLVFILTILFIQLNIYGLTSGPSMPEYNDFESVDNTDLVNLATGQFSYSIPVMTVPGPGLGFPIVLNYHAGILAKQEASWVGLGWNLQAGSITRQVNRIPDDFNGELITEKMTSSHIHGWHASAAYNGATVGVSWDSENGLGGMVGYSASLGNSPISAGYTIGFNGIYEGVNVNIGIGVGMGISNSISANASIGISMGTNSNGFGLGGGVGVGFNNKTPNRTNAFETSGSLASMDVSLRNSGSGAGIKSLASYSNNTSVSPFQTTQSNNYGVVIPVPYGFLTLNWGTWDSYIDGLSDDYYYGYLYEDANSMGCINGNEYDCFETEDYVKPAHGAVIPRLKKMELQVFDKLNSSAGPRLAQTTEDIYAVATQGISGSFRPIRLEDGDYFTALTAPYGEWGDWCLKIGSFPLPYLCEESQTFHPTRFLESGETNGTIGNNPRNLHITSNSHTHNIKWRFLNDKGGTTAINAPTSDRDALNPIFKASKKINPYYNEKGKIVAWEITKSDGTIYLYTQPVNNYFQINATAEDCDFSKKTTQVTPSYAYAWLLTAIVSPDYVRINSYSSANCSEYNMSNNGKTTVCLPSKGDVGGWVRFKYSDPRLYHWSDETIGHTPQSFKPNLEATSCVAPEGIKEIYYLENIITPTHTANLILNSEPRLDGKGLGNLEVNISKIIRVQGESTTLPAREVSCFNSENEENYTEFVSALKYEIDMELPAMYEGKPINLTGGMGYPDNVDCPIGIGQVWSISGDYPLIDGKVSFDAYPIKNQTMAGFTFDNLSDLASLGKIELINDVYQKKVQTIKFDYDYSLAKNTSNSNSSEKGRLTLKNLFQSGNVDGVWMPNYQFSYNGVNKEVSFNAAYGMNEVDKWGYYCESCGPGKREPDGTANVWNLDGIVTPSGQEIIVSYEPSTISFFEDKPIALNSDAYIPDYSYERENFIFKSSQPANEWEDFYHDIEIRENTGGCGEYATLSKTADEIQILNEPGVNLVPLGKFEQNSETGYLFDLAPFQSGPISAINTGNVENPQFYLLAMALGGVNLKIDGFAIPEGTMNSSELPAYSGDGFEIFYDLCSQITSIKFFDNLPNRIELGDAVYHRNRFKLWAAYSDEQLNYLSYWGGGIRAKQVSLKDAFTEETSSVNYNYFNGVTPILPNTFSYYNTDFYYNSSTGEASVSGSPAVIYERVDVSQNSSQYSNTTTSYHFISSKTAKNYLLWRNMGEYYEGYIGAVIQYLERGENNDGVNNKFEVYDRSNWWGLLWKKEELGEQNTVIRSEINNWKANFSYPFAELNQYEQEEFLAVNIENKQIIGRHLENAVVGPTVVQNKELLGVFNDVFSSRNFNDNCQVGEYYNDCLNKPGQLRTTQISKFNYQPYLSSTTTSQEGVEKIKEFSHFDYYTGESQLQMVNLNINDGIEHPIYKDLDEIWVGTYTQPAYYYYPEMESKNMLSQIFSTTQIVSSNSTENDINNVGTLGLVKFDDGNSFNPFSEVVASTFTTWDIVNVESVDEGLLSFEEFYVARKRDNFVYNGKNDFVFPDQTVGLGDENWSFQGGSNDYDLFGHAVELKNSLGIYSSKKYGYGQSLVTALVQNSKNEGMFYESFESNYDIQANCDPTIGFHCAQSLIGTDYVLSGEHSKSGNYSLALLNNGGENEVCFEFKSFAPNERYLASVWYFDARGGNTYPGISVENLGTNCLNEFQVVQNLNLPKSDVNYFGLPNQSNQWKRLELNFDCSSQAGNGRVCLYSQSSEILYDELRVHAENGQMTSYNYDEYGNMISYSDVNEVTSFFEYDDLNNLIAMKNEDGVVLSEQNKKHGRDQDPSIPRIEVNWVEGESKCLTPDVDWGDKFPQSYVLSSSNPTIASPSSENPKDICFSPENVSNNIGTSVFEVKFLETGNVEQFEFVLRTLKEFYAATNVGCVSGNDFRCQIHLAPHLQAAEQTHEIDYVYFDVFVDDMQMSSFTGTASNYWGINDERQFERLGIPESEVLLCVSNTSPAFNPGFVDYPDSYYNSDPFPELNKYFKIPFETSNYDDRNHYERNLFLQKAVYLSIARMVNESFEGMYGNNYSVGRVENSFTPTWDLNLKFKIEKKLLVEDWQIYDYQTIFLSIFGRYVNSLLVGYGLINSSTSSTVTDIRFMAFEDD